jgi:hypothetical protein
LLLRISEMGAPSSPFESCVARLWSTYPCRFLHCCSLSSTPLKCQHTLHVTQTAPRCSMRVIGDAKNWSAGRTCMHERWCAWAVHDRSVPRITARHAVADSLQLTHDSHCMGYTRRTGTAQQTSKVRSRMDGCWWNFKSSMRRAEGCSWQEKVRRLDGLSEVHCSHILLRG